MKDLITSDYQDCVNKILLRNKSILDILSKINISQAKIERGITKAVTHCGCLEINAKKQNSTESLKDFRENASSHINGALCSECKENIEKEMGTHLFYFTALCNALEIDIYDILLKEKQNMETLGRFYMR